MFLSSLIVGILSAAESLDYCFLSYDSDALLIWCGSLDS
jgi:hypothetical protein